MMLPRLLEYKRQSLWQSRVCQSLFSLIFVHSLLSTPGYSTLVPPSACPAFSANCTNIPHNEYVSGISADCCTIFGTYSIGTCQTEDQTCLCYNTLYHRVKGVTWWKKSAASVTVSRYTGDEDHFDCYLHNDGGCERAYNVNDCWTESFDSQAVSLSTLGTRTFTTSVINCEKSNIGCVCSPPPGCCTGPGQFDGQPATGYFHVYETNFKAVPSDRPPTTFTWNITPFTGDLSGQACDSVTPRRIMVRIEGPYGALTESPLYDGYQGSFYWDGSWQTPQGTMWDRISPITIKLTASQDPSDPHWGLASIVSEDAYCGDCLYTAQSFEDSLCMPCPCDTASECFACLKDVTFSGTGSPSNFYPVIKDTNGQTAYPTPHWERGRQADPTQGLPEQYPVCYKQGTKIRVSAIHGVINVCA
jgi:hypothetical protein